jgi:hypothetical protein
MTKLLAEMSGIRSNAVQDKLHVSIPMDELYRGEREAWVSKKEEREANTE